jgi:hypothetical protein
MAINVSFQQLEKGEKLPDGDIVRVLVADGGDPNIITVGLSLGVRWWKGIQSDNIVLCQAQDDQTSSLAGVPASQVHEHGLQLWKAKAFGVHTKMYNIENPRSWANGGKTYTFIWEHD